MLGSNDRDRKKRRKTVNSFRCQHLDVYVINSNKKLIEPPLPNIDIEFNQDMIKIT